jgi:hypothetical protein
MSTSKKERGVKNAPPSRNILARYILKIKDSQTLVKYARRSERIMAKTQADRIFKSSSS